MKLYRLCTLIAICLLLTACAPQAEFDIRGDWEYTMTAANGNIHDLGVITFSGQPTKGTYRQVNIYQVEYEGDYTVSGATLTLAEPETWVGEVAADAISGTWTHADGISGVFVATRRP